MPSCWSKVVTYPGKMTHSVTVLITTVILVQLPRKGQQCTVYPKKYAHGFCFAVLCCGYTLTDFPISIRLTSLALWQSNDCPSASKATLMNMDRYFMWIHYERLHNHNKAKHNKTVCIFLGIYCIPHDVCVPYNMCVCVSVIHWQCNVGPYTCTNFHKRAKSPTSPLLPRDGAFDLGLAVSVPLPIVTGIFVLLWFQSRLT